MKQTPYGNHKVNQTSYPFFLPELPFNKTVLDPHMSEATFDFHHGKHHDTYVQNLNKLLRGTDLVTSTLEGVILATFADRNKVGIFNNAAQVWNHSFFWHSMSPDGGGEPEGQLMDKIKEDFENYDKFVEEFRTTGANQFGSGWVWLVYDANIDKLLILKTPNADTPLVKNQTALINCDVWEHAYYLDYQNRKLDYLNVFLTYLVNWKFAGENFEAAIKK
jgi:superoxide dismutase, Fe-Mn family